MLLYHKRPGPRFEYIARYILEELCGSKFSITSDISYFSSFNGPSICYDEDRVKPDCIHIIPYGILEQSGIIEQKIEIRKWMNLPCFFSTGGDIPFDLFSASFFLITRYEEYLPHVKDEYGRYAHTNSLAFREKFLELPLLDLWGVELRKMMGVTITSMIPGKRVFRFVPSYDIDMAWCYLHKGTWRSTGGMIRSLFSGDLKKLQRQIAVLRGKIPDPYDVYEWLDALHLRYGLKPYYFFLLAMRGSEYDKNISPRHSAMRSLVSYHSAGYKLGIHPSWQSRKEEKLFKEEVSELSAITGSAVIRSRYHYIAFDMPDGYRKLIGNGILEDHSMGYGSINGFRASVSTPFPWYDLENEQQTDLWVHPFCWMDANSYYEQKYTAAQAFEELRSFHDIIKKAGGQMATISHVNFFSNEPEFAGWKDVYEIFLDEVVYWDL